MYSPSADASALYADVYEALSLWGPCADAWFRFLDTCNEADFAEGYEGLSVAFANMGDTLRAELFYRECLRGSVWQVGGAHFERYRAVFLAGVFGKERIDCYVVTLCGAADRRGAFILFNPEAAAGKNGEVGAQCNVIRVGRCYCPATGNVARLDVYGIYDVVRVLQFGLGDEFQLVFRRYG